MGLFHCFGNKLEEICVSLRWQLNVGAVSLLFGSFSHRIFGFPLGQLNVGMI